VAVAGYGGIPVVCDFVILGPTGTPYEGGFFTVKVTFEPGYPYKIPTVIFTTRIFAVHIMTMVNGTGKLMHLDLVWDSRWNMRILLTHIVSLLTAPNMSLIPPELMHTLNSWLTSKGYSKIQAAPSNVQGNGEEEVEAHTDNDALVSQLDADESYDVIFNSLARIQQMHLNVLSLFVCDLSRFNKTVSQMTHLYASNNSLSHLGISSEQSEAIDGVSSEVVHKNQPMIYEEPSNIANSENQSELLTNSITSLNYLDEPSEIFNHTIDQA